MTVTVREHAISTRTNRFPKAWTTMLPAALYLLFHSCTNGMQVDPMQVDPMQNVMCQSCIRMAWYKTLHMKFLLSNSAAVGSPDMLHGPPLTASSQPRPCHCKQRNMQHCIAFHYSNTLQQLYSSTLQRVSTCYRPLKAAGPSREQPRCLGAGLAVALHLLQQANPSALAMLPDLDGLPTPTSSKPGRILLITTGPATKVNRDKGLCNRVT